MKKIVSLILAVMLLSMNAPVYSAQNTDSKSGNAEKVFTGNDNKMPEGIKTITPKKPDESKAGTKSKRTKKPSTVVKKGEPPKAKSRIELSLGPVVALGLVAAPKILRGKTTLPGRLARGARRVGPTGKILAVTLILAALAPAIMNCAPDPDHDSKPSYVFTCPAWDPTDSVCTPFYYDGAWGWDGYDGDDGTSYSPNGQDGQRGEIGMPGESLEVTMTADYAFTWVNIKVCDVPYKSYCTEGGWPLSDPSSEFFYIYTAGGYGGMGGDGGDSDSYYYGDGGDGENGGDGGNGGNVTIYANDYRLLEMIYINNSGATAGDGGNGGDSFSGGWGGWGGDGGWGGNGGNVYMYLDDYVDPEFVFIDTLRGEGGWAGSGGYGNPSGLFGTDGFDGYGGDVFLNGYQIN
ncbi:hypothetical protein ACFL6Y_06640 [Elusimicrobiota bacterium]